ncbi:filamentous hemagglutinin N-terminal domain-containing protein [Candidatus Accumulibacter phosphatis]|uniref:Filamentous hemagglutinin N-terminal domain-containing protein n=1 Tax=Candidatus Accumulibacter contiguus TaxID=2954381 RepID=A0ABX1TFS2_9PROT|nr:filamentous hemagglutinin N-terminal domain-containing protein [Candidatus Accumulibacter contiguus]NMQ07851.1 filamentous hemagglutinin N-terminal domain-containing protein [Candidatus Accumulibacter contiguus]
MATDGSVGARQTIAGVNAGAGRFVIPQTLGSVVGNNLFHSFSKFNIDPGQTADFTTSTSALANVISRVSGGSLSQINGMLQLSAAAGSAPAFFFINPAGVVFGAGAAISVPGAFHVSTADYVKFANGDKFHADLGRASTLSSAAPAAFGFLGGTSAPIAVKDGAIVETQPSQPISIVAGDIEVSNDSAVLTQGGDIRVVALGNAAQEIGFTGALPAASGKLNILSGGSISSPATGAIDGGVIGISAGNISIDSQRSSSLTGIFGRALSGTGNAGSVAVSATEVLSLVNGGVISTSTYSAGDGGKAKISAGSIIIDGQGSHSPTGVFSNAAGTTGNAGSIDVMAAGALSIVNGGEIGSGTASSGKGGTVKVSVGSIAIDGQGSSTSITAIFADAAAGSTGNAGSVDVSATGALSIVHGGQITSITSSSGHAGTVKVSADSIAIDRQGSDSSTGIFSGAKSGSTGKAGHLDVTATGLLSLDNGGAISVDTSSSGDAGTVKVRAGSIILDHGSFISSDTLSGGNAGTVDVLVAEGLSIARGGVISSDTYSTGNASTVMVKAGSIAIDRQGSGSSTGIFSRAKSGSTGKAGHLDVTATGLLSLDNGGAISSDTSSSGDAGTVKVRAGSIILDHGSFISSDTLSGGNAGTVDVSVAEGLSIARGGVISSDTYSTGNASTVMVKAGSIAIDRQGSGSSTGIFSRAKSSSTGMAGHLDVTATGLLSLDNGGAISSDTSSSGDAGTVKVRAGSIILDHGSFISSDTLSGGNAGTVDVSVAEGLSIARGGVISSDTYSTGNASTVIVKAGSIAIDRQGSGSSTGIFSRATSSSTGMAGHLDVTATGLLSLDNGGAISSDTSSSGDAGTVKVRAGSLILDHGSFISSDTLSGGNADSVEVSATGDLLIVNGGVISSDTYSSGHAGKIKVSAGSITIGSQESREGGIMSRAKVDSSGNAGNIEVKATGSLSLVNGGVISSSTSSSGNAGLVEVNAGIISIDRQDDRPENSNRAGIFSNADPGSTGNAGRVEVVATGNLSIVYDGVISSSTASSGNAGTVKVSADSITIDSRGSRNRTGIFTIAAANSAGNAGDIEVSATGKFSLIRSGEISSETSSSGDAGMVKVSAGMIAIDNGGQISSSTTSSGNAGTVKLSAGSITINGQGSSQSTGIYSTAEGDRSGNAGGIEVSAKENFSIDNGGVSSSTFSTGNAGTVKVSAGNVVIDSGSIASDTSSAGKAGGVEVLATENLSLVNGGLISSDTNSSGHAGTVKVRAGSIAINGKGSFAGIFSNANPGSTGNAGSIEVVATGNLSLVNGGVIASHTFSSGNGGTAKVSAGTITIDGVNRVDLFTGILSGSGATDKGPSGYGGDIAVTADVLSLTRGGVIFAGTNSNGRGGTINLQVKHLALTEGGAISTDTSGTGNAGEVIIQGADDVVISGVSDQSWRRDNDGQLVTGQFSGVYLNTTGSGNGGNLHLTTKRLTLSDGGIVSAIAVDGSVANLPETRAGNVHIDAGTIVLSDGGAIDASTSGAGKAGSISVNADTSISISGTFDHAGHPNVTNPRELDQSHIGSSATYALNKNAKTLGPGGDVTVTTPKLILTNGGQIVVTTEGAQRAGSIQIGAGTLLVDGESSTISAEASGRSSGQTGFVSVVASDITLSNGGHLSIENNANVEASVASALTPTSITVNAPRITLLNSLHAITTESTGNVAAGNIRITASDQLQLDPSGITTTAFEGNGGAIDITAGLLRLDHSQITTSVTGSDNGNGGNIRITADSLILNTGFIQANTKAANASGGNVSITTQNLVASGNTLFLGGNTPYTYQSGVFGVNVIQAAAPTGISGTVQISTPKLDVTTSLVGLDTRLINAQVARRLCENARGSSLVPVGRGGLPPGGADYLSPGQISGIGFVTSPTVSLPSRHASWPNPFSPCLAAL